MYTQKSVTHDKKLNFKISTMLTRGLQRDVVYLCWPIAPSYTSPNEWGMGVAGSPPMSKAVHIKWHGAQINFGDLPPYLTYDADHSFLRDVLSLPWVRGNASGGANVSASSGAIVSAGAIGSANISAFPADSALVGQGARQVIVARQAALRVIAADKVN
jgi:hypothetical protein